MDRKVIRTYKDYIEQGNDNFDFDVWMNKMTDSYDGYKDGNYDARINDIYDTLHDTTYCSAKEKLSKSRLFNGASKFSVTTQLDYSATFVADPKQKADEMLKITNAPFDNFFPYLYDRRYDNIIFNKPFEEHGLSTAIHLGVKFLLSEAMRSHDRARLFRTLLVLDIFITLSEIWTREYNRLSYLYTWESSEKDMTKRGIEGLQDYIRIRVATESSTGLANLKTILAAYAFLPNDVTYRIVDEYLESGTYPSDEVTAELFDSLSDEIVPTLLDTVVSKIANLNVVMTYNLYPRGLGLIYILPLPEVLERNLEKKLSHIPNAKGQMKMSVKGLNNFLYNPKLTTLVMKELTKDVEDNHLWNTGLGKLIIEQLYQGYREALGKTAWKDISQEHFTYEHLNNVNNEVEMIFSLEKEDIWTASSAGNSWTSCHAGSYGHSPMFLGGDEITFVVYEKGDEMADEGVDSKRWRAYCHLWYDKNDKTKMAFSVEHAYPSKNKQLSLVIKDIILDGLDCVYIDSDTLFNHETINVLEGTVSHGYYDYNERSTDNYYTFDVLSVDEEYNEYFWIKGCEALGYYEDEPACETLDAEVYNSIINLGCLINYCDESGINLHIEQRPSLYDISALGETFTAASRAIYTLMDKDDDISFGHGRYLSSLDNDEDLGGVYSTNYLPEIVDYYYSSLPQSIEWYM